MYTIYVPHQTSLVLLKKNIYIYLKDESLKFSSGVGGGGKGGAEEQRRRGG